MAQNRNEDGASLHLDGDTLFCQGDWVAPSLHIVEKALAGVNWPSGPELCIDLSGIRLLDSAGAWMVRRVMREQKGAGRSTRVINASPRSEALLALVDRDPTPVQLHAPHPGMLEEAGQFAVREGREAVSFIGFIGELGTTVVRSLRQPERLRVAMLWHDLEAAGFRALPIVGLLTFLLGIVIAYQGGVQLQKYGANLYITDLVSISMLRELAPLITAIIIAGRTGSAYTAQIGTMKVNDEIDALRTMGIAPMEQLVFPKVLALMIAMPLLTVYADIMGLAGGAVIANAVLDVSPTSFIQRVGEAVSLSAYLVGIGKAPVFAMIIGSVGCFQGFQVNYSAESVGRRTTVSVVQSIFLVIVVDALFSIIFSRLGL